MVEIGDNVVAVRNGEVGPMGPVDIPVKGEVYTITGIYRMLYGLGCTLEGMCHVPYRGYVLFAKEGNGMFPPGWYFERVEPVEIKFLEHIGVEL